MKLHIFTIATGVYNNYLKYQIKSLNNIYPGIEKTWNLISDTEYKLDLKEFPEYIASNYYHICNLPYPFNAYFKFQYICDMIKLLQYNNTDLFLFCDVDSYFIEKTEDFYKNLFADNRLHFPYSPWILCGADITNWEMSNIHNIRSISYVKNLHKEEFKIVQTSLVFGSIQELFNKNKIWMDMIAKDSAHKTIPYIYDQSIINKYIYVKSDDIIRDNYITNYYSDINNFNGDFNNNDISFKLRELGYYYVIDNNLFCIQKFNQHIKANKRNVDKFDNNI